MSNRETRGGDERNIRLLYGFSFLKNLQFFGALAVPFYLDRVGLDYARMFSLEALFSLCIILFEIPTGVVADRAGRKVSLFAGSLVFGAGFAVFGFATGFVPLAIAEIVCAVGMCLQSGADRALLYEVARATPAPSWKSAPATGHEAGAASDQPNPDIQTVLSRYDAIGTAGMLVAFPAGTLFVASGLVPYRTALGLVFVATAAALIVSGFIALGVHESTRLPPDGSALRAGIDGFRMIFRKPALTRFSLNYAAISSLTFFMFWFYQSLLRENGFPLSYQGFVAAAFNAGSMLLLLASGPVRRRLGAANTLFLSSLVPGVLYVCVFLAPGLPMALVAIFGVTMLRSFRAPLLGALMNDEIGDKHRATVLSGVSMLERVLTTALYPLAGLLTDVSLGWTFLAMGAVTVFMSVFLRVDRELEGRA